ncbi:hypothetical protein BU24DRAFT_387707 [Aaosphaeria arxii CBS 175.79]|uniref:Tetraspanin Tsp3 n=1 Tax=Aaosphaeria arxii CBS 175.79 TaxID=1450172 RepID=A0A6A5XVB6_9PLEO|nr:uncharacterized protein BU24DRAFT_387707 [Aaosphaeria arxii CBS 175.79]KAF2016879.1 hypothetical protein BU24DRAFT_387707 [Aaosphaeria arxii CBS 175.79]
MATHSRKQIVVCVSIIYHILLTALAACGWSRATKFQLPISDVLMGFATVLPCASGILLWSGYDLTSAQERRDREPKGSTPRPPLVTFANTVIFIYSTVVMTLLGTHAAPPAGLNCGLEDRWKRLFMAKNSEVVRTIQEALQCCGFVNSHDRAWPFPDRSHDAHACEKAFGYTRGCLGPLKAEEQRVSGMLMATVGLVFIWQVVIIVYPTKRDSWLHRVMPEQLRQMILEARQQHGDGDGGPRRAIDYLPTYRDRVEEEDVTDEEDGGVESQGRRAITEDRERERSALSEMADGQHSSIVENEWTRG